MQAKALFANVAWNGMLALIPVVAGYVLRMLLDRNPVTLLRYAAASVLGVVWFVFLPNTCYLLTEWRHLLFVLDAGDLFLRARHDSILLTKLVLGSLFYFSYALFGMVTFAMAIRPVERLAIKKRLATRFWAIPFFAAVSLGVYLGLVLRFNSWELATCPGKIWTAVVEVGGRPLLSAMILGFGAFLWAAYECLDIWLDGLQQRVLKGKAEA